LKLLQVVFVTLLKFFFAFVFLGGAFLYALPSIISDLSTSMTLEERLGNLMALGLQLWLGWLLLRAALERRNPIKMGVKLWGKPDFSNWDVFKVHTFTTEKRYSPKYGSYGPWESAKKSTKKNQSDEKSVERWENEVSSQIQLLFNHQSADTLTLGQQAAILIFSLRLYERYVEGGYCDDRNLKPVLLFFAKDKFIHQNFVLDNRAILLAESKLSEQDGGMYFIFESADTVILNDGAKSKSVLSELINSEILRW